jgi:hypothetical protein
MDGTGWEDFGEASGGSQQRFGGMKKDQGDNFGGNRIRVEESRKEDKN